MKGIKKEFTEQETQFIKDNYPKMSVYALKKHFKCSWYAIRDQIVKLGWIPPENANWTDEEKKQLEILAGKYSLPKIAKQLGKSENAVYIKARRLGIILQKGWRMWTPEEEGMLEELWGAQTLESIAKNLRRTPTALKIKAQRMGLPPMIDNSGNLTIPQLCKILGVSRDRIDRWGTIGLHIKSKPITKNKRYKYIEVENLLEFLKNNPSEYDASKIEERSLGIEPDWLKAKRKTDTKSKESIREYVDRRYWTDAEKRLLKSSIKSGLTYKQITQRINRSEEAIGIKARELGLSYKSGYHLQGCEIKFVKDNYMNMTHAEMARHLHTSIESIDYICERYRYIKRNRSNTK